MLQKPQQLSQIMIPRTSNVYRYYGWSDRLNTFLTVVNTQPKSVCARPKLCQLLVTVSIRNGAIVSMKHAKWTINNETILEELHTP